MAQWNAVTPQFSRGITTAMGNASDSINKVGAMAHQYLADAKEQERYDTAQARQKVLDDRATEEYQLKKDIRQGIIDTEQAKTMAAPYVKDVVAFNDPKYAAALEQWQARGNKDITQSADILAAYNQPHMQPVQGGLSQVRQGVIQGQPSVGSMSTGSVGTTVGSVRGPNTVRQEVVPGTEGYVKGDPTVNYKLAEYAKPKTDLTRTVGESWDKFLGNTPDTYKEGPMTSSRKHKLESVDAKYEKLLAPKQEYLRQTFDGSGRTAGFDKVASEITTLQKAMEAEKKEIMRDKSVPKPGSKEVITRNMETTLSSINTANMYDQNGKPLTGDKSSDKVYFKDKSGNLVNALDVGRSMQANFVPGKPATTITKEVQGPILKAPSKSAVSSGREPAFKMTAEYVTQSAKASGMQPTEIQAGMDRIGGEYQSILDMLGKDNNKERDALREMVNSQASQSGLTPADYDTSKAVDAILPTNELTGRQKTAVDLAVKELDNIRSDKRWQEEMNFKVKEAQWNHAMDRAKLSLQQAGINEQRAERLSKAENQTVPMYKILPSGQHEVIKVPIGSATQMEKAGYKPGTLSGTRITANAGKEGTSKIDLMELGGSQMLGGTSGIDLVTMSKRMKAEFPKVSQTAIDSEIANLSQGWLTDSVNLSDLRKNLQGYQK